MLLHQYTLSESLSNQRLLAFHYGAGSVRIIVSPSKAAINAYWHFIMAQRSRPRLALNNAPRDQRLLAFHYGSETTSDRHKTTQRRDQRLLAFHYSSGCKYLSSHPPLLVINAYWHFIIAQRTAAIDVLSLSQVINAYWHFIIAQGGS